MSALLALGTAVAQQTGDQYLSLRTPRAAVTARISGTSVVAPDVQLSRDGQNVRGRAYGKTVSLSLKDNEVGGTVGSQLARLNLETKGDVTEAQGNFAGSLTRLHLGPEALTGTVGRCSYDLKATKNGDYQGSRSCGGTPERPVVLEIPHALADQGPAMTLATLALLLGTP